VAPDVVTNTRADEGRLVVIVMDRSIPAGPGTVMARKIASAVVDALGPSDLGAIVMSSGFSNELEPHNFTADRARLRAAIARPFMGQVSPPTMGPGGLQPAPAEMRFTGDCMCGTCSTGALERVADAMATESRRQKVAVFIGRDIVIQSRPMGFDKECELPIKDGRERALRALDRANVTVHSIDPSGLESLAAQADPMAYRPSQRENLARQGNLAVFPDYTGGRVVVNANDPQSHVPAIFEESQSYYLLGFRRGEGPLNARRSIRVRVNRSGVTVRSRSGSYAPSPAPAPASPEAPSASAIADLLPRGGIPLTLGLTPRFRPDGEQQVSVGLRLDTAGPAGSSPASPRRFDVTIGVFDPRAKNLGTERQVVEVPTDSPTRGADGFETESSLALAPGRYEIRVGVADPDSQQTGSVHGYVEVLDVKDEPFVVSGVTLGRRGVATPTLRREFSTSEPVTASLQVRRRDERTGPVTIRARIVDDQDRATAESTATLDASAFTAGGIAEFRFDLPLATLRSGDHLLAIEASNGRRVEKRDVRIRVR
jgi:VWFA-related protein